MPSREPKDYYMVMVRRDDETKYVTFHMCTKWDAVHAMDRLRAESAFWHGETAKVSYAWWYTDKEYYMTMEAKFGRALQEPIIITDKN